MKPLFSLLTSVRFKATPQRPHGNKSPGRKGFRIEGGGNYLNGARQVLI